MQGKGRSITFHNDQRPQAAFGGQPPAAARFKRIETDPQVQAGAKHKPETVQMSGSSLRPFPPCEACHCESEQKTGLESVSCLA
jgi:hypothetical protein